MTGNDTKKPCPIFEVISAAVKLDSELSLLPDAIMNGLKNHDQFQVDEKNLEWENNPSENEGEWVNSASTMIIPFKYKRNGQRGRPRANVLSIRFDLTRKTSNASWKHAKDALLVIGYSPDPQNEGYWESHLLAVNPDGRLPIIDDDYDPVNKIQGNLLLCVDDPSVDSSCIDNHWVFAVPMKEITNAEKVSTEIIAPIARLLEGDGPAEALKNTSAVEWDKSFLSS